MKMQILEKKIIIIIIKSKGGGDEGEEPSGRNTLEARMVNKKENSRKQIELKSQKRYSQN